MIKVNVEITGVLKKPFGKNKFAYELPEGTDVHEFLVKLNYDENHIMSIDVMVNDEYVGMDTILKDGDNVYLSIIVGGG